MFGSGSVSALYANYDSIWTESIIKKKKKKKNGTQLIAS